MHFFGLYCFWRKNKQTLCTVLNSVVDTPRPVFPRRNIPAIKPDRHSPVFQMPCKGENELLVLARVTNENMIPHSSRIYHTPIALEAGKDQGKRSIEVKMRVLSKFLQLLHSAPPKTLLLLPPASKHLQGNGASIVYEICSGF